MGPSSYLSRSFRVFATVFMNPDLRRLELAFIGFNTAEWATWLAILVYAYGVGGVTAAGLVALIQLVPSALVAPLAAAAGDRLPRERVTNLGKSVAVMGESASFTAGPGNIWLSRQA